MKLRLESDSITIRLSPTEIDALNHEKSIKECIKISAHNTFEFRINVVDDMENSHVHFGKQSLSINMPSNKIERWLNSNQVGIREMVSIESGELLLVVEEDLRPQGNKNREGNHATYR